MKLNITSAALLAIVLLLTSSLVVVASNSILLAQAKKSSRTTGVAGGVGVGFAVEPPIGTEPLTPSATANNSAAALAIAHRLAITSVNASNTYAGPCLSQLDHFILPPKLDLL